ncbi:MAG: hypothetical protein AUJ92_11435 [Armatimonadetes bacterium CG2_30_59_28]|nr:DegT/DnrJ/EryC1/StrS family aminotransferase [Armatimonadota bacterium]OIO93884.1 MAG: hypothetical protein AUJ92_11435 [Armatimonadetes bacterium CG2_30_59_28]PIU61930.1 MAG: DegT/DnrJ/EryC1/StrS family aminotransferase [Armatimonadetes bacterium CG07_land_8_20_14_0_80_59_28]PJB67831.1 MAG: DegT/DnrJ/EryC1/StrS family aminotransferase [Armatimonadetes bacterium CG_4_9_14_3_um_filter_58_7]
MTQDAEPTLAVDGGTAYRTMPFPARTPFGDAEIELVTQAIRSQNLFGLGGKMVSEFEKRFCSLYGAKHAVASTSGTAAIHIAIGAVNPEPGDEIITAPITDGGTIVPILYQNAIPVFADIDNSYNMAPKNVESKTTNRTKAILVVHLFGNPCDMDAMVDIAQRHKVALIEDCSQAHMTEYKGRLLGTIGDFGCFSLQQSKHMTTGDGGVTITSRSDLSERMMLFRDKGWTRKPGWGARSYAFLAPNYRMTELQGAVGIAQTEKVMEVVSARNRLGSLLTCSLQGVPGIEPAPVTEGGKHSYWAYPLRILDWPARCFAESLSAEGIPANPGYIGEPIFLCMEALASRTTFGNSHHPLDGCHGGRVPEYSKGMCPQTEEELSRLVVIGISESMSEEDIRDMAGAIRKVAARLPKG